MTTRVQLFTSCMVDLFRPRAAIAAVRVLQRRDIHVEVPERQTCCGQFAFNAGHHREAAAMGRQFVRAFEANMAGSGPANIGSEPDPPPVVALSGSCAAMVKVEMPALLERDALQRGETPENAARWRRRGEVLGARVVEFSEWLDGQGVRLPPGQVEPDPEKSENLTVACHTGCHMRRLLRVTESPSRVLRGIGVEAVELNDAEQCCGFGGSFGLIEPELSAAMADARLEQLAIARSEGAVGLVSSDLGCLMQLGGRLSRRGDDFPTLHLAEMVDLADEGRLGAAEIERTARRQGEP